MDVTKLTDTQIIDRAVEWINLTHEFTDGRTVAERTFINGVIAYWNTNRMITRSQRVYLDTKLWKFKTHGYKKTRHTRRR